MLTNY
jgi:hypothetical protein